MGKSFKIPSRNKKVIHSYEIICPYCKDKYTDETEDDYYTYENTKINYCRKCGLEFINGITRDIEYKYS